MRSPDTSAGDVAAAARKRPSTAKRKRTRCPLSSSASAIRQRRSRRRRDEGVRVAQVEIPFERAVEALKRRDGLNEIQAQALRWPDVEREVQLLANDWIVTWTT
jgi:hypothetical protein